ncbi:MAG: hypothetical protein ABJA81_05380 [Nocardioidaceae bacterium]
MSLEGLGFLLGSAVTVAFTGELAVWMLANAYHDFNPYGFEPVLKWLTIATPVAGYLAATGLVVTRTLRRLGVGMLIGLTLALPVPSCLTFLAQFGLWYGEVLG